MIYFFLDVFHILVHYSCIESLSGWNVFLMASRAILIQNKWVLFIIIIIYF